MSQLVMPIGRKGAMTCAQLREPRVQDLFNKDPFDLSHHVTALSRDFPPGHLTLIQTIASEPAIIPEAGFESVNDAVRYYHSLMKALVQEADLRAGNYPFFSLGIGKSKGIATLASYDVAGGVRMEPILPSSGEFPRVVLHPTVNLYVPVERRTQPPFD